MSKEKHHIRLGHGSSAHEIGQAEHDFLAQRNLQGLERPRDDRGDTPWVDDPSDQIYGQVVL